ncbi:MAG: sodium:proton antiporter [Oscillospiraceae bacterium]|nr:sodium:proton antiporter [Oscillospiraceae bacterium]
MAFVQNVPFFSIMLSMFSGIVSSILPGKWARRLNTFMIIVVAALSAWLFAFMATSDIGSYTYAMGHFPAPIGNELRAGVLEAGTALFFCIIMLLSLWGGREKQILEITERQQNLYYILCNLLLSSLLALIYTNDLFTAYVFIEINTIAAGGLIMVRQNGHCIEATIRYMIMSLLGSGLLLMGICMLYDLTGHLLMSNIKEQVDIIMAAGTYRIPMLITIGIMTVGLAIKSALFPFHSWVPDAYGYSTVSSGAILSSLVSKGYIFLLIKIFYRVIGFDTIAGSHILNILFIFGLCGMIFGSVSAIGENDIRRMIAFSSVAQIGYIYMGLGLGTEMGVIAAVFHLLSHGATKSLLFVSAVGLTDASGGSRHFTDLTGAAFRNKTAGVGFLVGSFSMVGIPVFAGFVSKLLFAEAAVLLPNWKMFPTLIVLAVSTVLNAIYFLKTVIRIYTPVKPEVLAEKGFECKHFKQQVLFGVTIVLFIIVNLILGMKSQPIIELIEQGLHNFM